MGDHLLPHVRHYLRAKEEDRIFYIRSPRWIGSAAALQALDRMEQLLARPPSLRMAGLMLVGPYSNGKTVIAERFALQHMKAIGQQGGDQKIWVVQTSERPGLSNFYTAIIRAMGRIPTNRRELMVKEAQLHHLLAQLKPRVLIFDEFHNAFRGRQRDTEAVFAFLRRLGREYNIASVLVGEVAVYDQVNAGDEMGSRVDLCAVPRWPFDEEYLALLEALESAIPLAYPSGLSAEAIARAIFTLSEGLIGQIVAIVAEAAVLAVKDGCETISLETIRRLDHVPLSQRRNGMVRAGLV